MLGEATASAEGTSSLDSPHVFASTIGSGSHGTFARASLALKLLDIVLFGLVTVCRFTFWSWTWFSRQLALTSKMRTYVFYNLKPMIVHLPNPTFTHSNPDQHAPTYEHRIGSVGTLGTVLMHFGLAPTTVRRSGTESFNMSTKRPMIGCNITYLKAFCDSQLVLSITFVNAASRNAV